MFLTIKLINILTTILLVLQLCLPAYGPAYFSEVTRTAEASHAGVVCAHVEVDSHHKSQDNHSDMPPCHELDAPCAILSGWVLDQRIIIATLLATDEGIILPGYGSPFDIPPQNRV